MLIMFFSFYTVWMWVIFLTFRMYVLPPTSGLKCVGWRISVYVYYSVSESNGGKGEI
jgi:hypothetical protein